MSSRTFLSENFVPVKVLSEDEKMARVGFMLDSENGRKLLGYEMAYTILKSWGHVETEPKMQKLRIDINEAAKELDVPAEWRL